MKVPQPWEEFQFACLILTGLQRLKLSARTRKHMREIGTNSRPDSCHSGNDPDRRNK